MPWWARPDDVRKPRAKALLEHMFGGDLALFQINALSVSRNESHSLTNLNGKVRVRVVDHHPPLRAGVAAVLNGKSDLTIVGEATFCLANCTALGSGSVPATEPYDTGSSNGTENRNTAPCGTFAAADRCPPCASTMVRLIDNPMPSPSALVV
jgi:hypothetical protein